MEVSSDIYKNIRVNNNKVFIGWQCCRVYDLVNIKPCYNCGRFGHNGAKCKNESTCLKCTQKHTADMCESESLLCPNCSFSNQKYNTAYNTNHEATDSNLCFILKSKIRNYIETTDYPMKPILSTVKPKLGHYQMKINDQLDNSSDACSITSESNQNRKQQKRRQQQQPKQIQQQQKQQGQHEQHQQQWQLPRNKNKNNVSTTRTDRTR